MASIAKFSTDELRLARKGGFKRKRPKKPKGKSISSLEGFVDRYNQWVKDMKSAASGAKRAEIIKKAIRGI